MSWNTPRSNQIALHANVKVSVRYSYIHHTYISPNMLTEVNDTNIVKAAEKTEALSIPDDK